MQRICDIKNGIETVATNVPSRTMKIMLDAFEDGDDLYHLWEKGHMFHIAAVIHKMNNKYKGWNDTGYIELPEKSKYLFIDYASGKILVGKAFMVEKLKRQFEYVAKKADMLAVKDIPEDNSAEIAELNKLAGIAKKYNVQFSRHGQIWGT